MIEIQNFQFGLAGSTFTAVIDGQPIENCRTSEDCGQLRVIVPQAASRIEWGEHALADVEAEVRKILSY